MGERGSEQRLAGERDWMDDVADAINEQLDHDALVDALLEAVEAMASDANIYTDTDCAEVDGQAYRQVLNLAGALRKARGQEDGGG